MKGKAFEQEIKDRFGVSQSTISRTLKGYKDEG
jgi:transposase